MNLIQRAFKSITRRTSKSLVLFGIIFLLGNLLCASLAISTSVSQLENDFINQLGAKIEITSQHYLEHSSFYEENLDLLLKNIETIENRDILKFHDIHYFIDGFTSNQLVFKTDSEITSSTLPIHLYSSNQTQSFDIAEGKMQFVDGRWFNEEELKNGEHVLVLSNRFFTQQNNKLIPVHVGDKITLSRNYLDNDKNIPSEEVFYQVIGIFEKLDTLELSSNRYDILNPESHLIIPEAAMIQEDLHFLESNQKYGLPETYHRMLLEKIEFKLKKAHYTDHFNGSFNQDNPILEYFDIKSSQDIYDRIAEPLNSLSVVADKLIVITTIAVIVLLSLVVVVFLKDRRHEIGILYAMGEHRIKIVAQVILELLVIGMVAISLAMVSGKQIGATYTDYMIENQRKSSQYIVVDHISQEEVLDNYELAFNQDYILNVYITTFGVIMISALFPTAYILHLKPRKILL